MDLLLAKFLHVLVQSPPIRFRGEGRKRGHFPMTKDLRRFQNANVILIARSGLRATRNRNCGGAAIVLKLAQGRYMQRIRALSAAAALLIAGAAQADLARVGPNSPAAPAVPTTTSGNGFPLWYQDSPGGMVLDLCLPDANDRGTFAALNQGNDAQALACFVPFNPPPGGYVVGHAKFNFYLAAPRCDATCDAATEIARTPRQG